MSGTIAVAIFIGLVAMGTFGALPSKAALQHLEQANASLVVDRHGQLLGSYFTYNRTSIPYDQLPNHLIEALLATEDARFFSHGGVDYRSVLRVLMKNVIGGNEAAGGGSTITQQLVKNLFGRERGGWWTLLVEKTKEALIARRIERLYSKEEILALYLNTVPFGEEVYGIEAAARRYFSKPASTLAIEEAAVLVGMLKANTTFHPVRYPEQSRERRNVVLWQMTKYDYLAPPTADSLMALPLVTQYNNLSDEGPAGYFLAYLRPKVEAILAAHYTDKPPDDLLESGGFTIHTTLDIRWQKALQEAYSRHLPVMNKHLKEQYQQPEYASQLKALARQQLPEDRLTDPPRPMVWYANGGYHSDTLSPLDSLERTLLQISAGSVVLAPEDGAILGWQGGVHFPTRPYDQVLAMRPVASLMKPILAAAALEAGVDPCQRLENDPLLLEEYPRWRPANYDNTVGGSYSMAGALIHSKNLPAIQLLFPTGFTAFAAMWDTLGFTRSLPHGPAAALGAVEANVLEVAAAYATIANDGVRYAPFAIDSIVDRSGEVIYRRVPAPGVRVMDSRTARILQHILQQVVSEGTARALPAVAGLQGTMAGKTGTAQNYSDAWFAGMTPKVVTVARVGAPFPAIHFSSGQYGSGSRLALPLVGYAWQYALQNGVDVGHGESFAPLTAADKALLDCPGYKAPSRWSEWLDVFDKEKSSIEAEQRKAARRAKWRSLWDKVFGR